MKSRQHRWATLGMDLRVLLGKELEWQIVKNYVHLLIWLVESCSRDSRPKNKTKQKHSLSSGKAELMEQGIGAGAG